MLEISEKKTIFVISDTHFHDWPKEEEMESFLSFLEMVREEGNELFLLGDIFDFYFEYKSFIPKSFFKIFFGLQKIIEEGISVHYWVGNHDFWIGDFFEGLGVVKHLGPEIIKVGKRRILVQHGDEIDTNFMVKTCLTNKFSRLLFSLIHPELGLLIAKAVSRFSQTSSRKIKLRDNSFENYAEKEFSQGVDAVIMGHFHKPYFYREGKKTLSIFGDWKHCRSYGVIVNGNISVMRFTQSPK